MTPTPAQRRTRVRFVLLAFWSVPAWLTVLQMRATAAMLELPAPSWRAYVPALAEWYLWALLTPAILALARRVPLRWPVRPVAVLVHAAAIGAVSVVRGGVYAGVTVLVGATVLREPFLHYLRRISMGWLPVAAVVYGAIVAAGTALALARRSQAGERRAARLEARLARAEAATLRAHIHPHFLFNALHTVGALVRTERRGVATHVIAELSELLRELLRPDAPEEVTLATELRFVRRYLAILEIRFQDRLRVTWRIDDDAAAALVPRLILQPLVENAARHGIGAAGDAGRIVIAARHVGADLELTVTDDGPGLNPRAGAIHAPRSGPSPGTGLTATRARLARHYGAGAAVTLTPAAPRGVVATVRLPYRRASTPLSPAGVA